MKIYLRKIYCWIYSYINEADYNEYYEVPNEWNSYEYYGRISYFVFILNDFFDNFKSCRS